MVSQTILFFSLVIAAFAFMAIAIAVPAIPLAIRVILVFIALVIDVVAFSTRYYAYLYGPLLKMKNRTITLSNEEAFTMSPSGNAIVVREGEYSYASVFIKVPVYKSATEMSDEEKSDFATLFSRVVTLSKEPFRVATQLYVINKDEYINRIREKLNAAEERYQTITSNSKSNKKDVERVKGEVTMWHNLFDNVSRAASNSLVTYAQVTSAGGSEEEAVNIAIRRADEIASGIGAIFGVAPTVVQGTEILSFIEPEYLIPIGTVSEQIRQRTVAGGL